MNELLFKRYEKKVLRYGISREMAKEIVQTAMSVSKGDNLDKAISYAIDLTYGLGFTKRFAK